MEMGTLAVLKAQVWERRFGAVLFILSAQPLENDNDEMFSIRQFNEEKRESIQRMVTLSLICFILGPKTAKSHLYATLIQELCKTNETVSLSAPLKDLLMNELSAIADPAAFQDTEIANALAKLRDPFHSLLTSFSKALVSNSLLHFIDN